MELHEERIECLAHTDDTVEDMELYKCTLAGCNFSNVVLSNCKFVNCAFENCAWKNVTFSSCSMLNGSFHECFFMGLDWSNLRRQGTRLPLVGKMLACTVKYNTFVKMDLGKTDFSRSALYDCYFQECSLQRSIFSHCVLENSTFQECDLAQADFRHASHYTSGLLNNKITGARFSLPEAVALLGGFNISVE